MENAYKTLLDIGGLEKEDDYSYDGHDETCKFNEDKAVLSQIVKFDRLPNIFRN